MAYSGLLVLSSGGGAIPSNIPSKHTVTPPDPAGPDGSMRARAARAPKLQGLCEVDTSGDAVLKANEGERDHGQEWF